MEDLYALLLGAPLTLTQGEVIARAGVPEELAKAVWAALGFAEVAPEEVAFTELDVQALRDSIALVSAGIVDRPTQLMMARTMGQALSRLAEAQLDVFRKMAGDLSVDEAELLASATAADVLPRIESLLLHVWRRQFSAAAQRALAGTRDAEGLVEVAVGFIDLVDYTRSSREWDAARLERTLETFERDLSLRVAAVGGQVVKTLGDGVLFTTRTSVTAVQVALDTIEAHLADQELPSVRAGVAFGPVLVRLGDVYGEPVNLASRLCDEARPATLLVSRAVADAVAEADGLELRSLGRRSVRGYRSMSPYLVRRA